jgi:hypothetical protein
MKQLILVYFTALSVCSFAQSAPVNCSESFNRPIVIDYPAAQLIPLSADPNMNEKTTRSKVAVSLINMRMAEQEEPTSIPKETRIINYQTGLAIPVRPSFKSSVKRIEETEINQGTSVYKPIVNNIKAEARKISSE